MDRRDAMAIAREFRELHKRQDDRDRRMASMILTGKVKQIDGDRIRLEIMPADSRTGKPFLSPWVKVQEAAGQSSTHFPVKEGDPMRLLSPNGEIGAQSLAVRGGYTDDAKNPSDKPQDTLVIGNGGPVIIRGSNITLEAEGAVNAKSGTLTHNDVYIGEGHTHTRVERGSELSGPPPA